MSEEYQSPQRREINTGKWNPTCFGVRSNFLPPILKAILGIEDRALQSTVDSPMGLGSRSHSCNTNIGI